MCGRAWRTYAEVVRFGRKQSEALLDPGKADLVAETADGVVELVNELTPGRARGMPYPAPTGIDRVFVDVARNAQCRSCSPQCQSRVKAAAHRARKAAS